MIVVILIGAMILAICTVVVMVIQTREHRREIEFWTGKSNNKKKRNKK